MAIGAGAIAQFGHLLPNFQLNAIGTAGMAGALSCWFFLNQQSLASDRFGGRCLKLVYFL